MRELRFNVGGNPGDDIPYAETDPQPEIGKPSVTIPGTLGREEADGSGVFTPGGTPVNRMQMMVPQDVTGAAWVYYQQGTKKFRIIFPPLEATQFQSEAGQPPQLPPEYPDPDMVALHYGPAKPIFKGRTGRVTRIGNSYSDDGGLFNPLGDTMLYALGHWMRGGPFRELVQENVEFIASYGHEHIRFCCELPWAGNETDPSRPDFESQLADMLDWLGSRGIRSHITITGGGGNSRLAAQKLRNVLVGREHLVLLGESVNELNDSAANAIWIAQFLKQLGILVSVGRGNSGIVGIKADGVVAGADIDDLHTERGLGDPSDPGGPAARQVRQCWDFASLRQNAMKLDGEGPGPTSSGAVLDDPFYLALRRFANVACGAEAQTCHFGAGVYGMLSPSGPNGYQSSYGYRHAHFKDIPNIDRIMRGLRNADFHIPKGVANWRAFNTHPEMPWKPVTDGQCSKINGSRTGRDFVETIIGSITGPFAIRAEQAVNSKIVNPETKEVLFDGHASQGQVVTLQGLQGYGIVGLVD